MIGHRLIPLLLTAAAPAPETPAQIAAILARGNPDVARLLAEHPDMQGAWSEDFWADALLRAPLIPGTHWRAHDLRRPQPPIVTPAIDECNGPAPPDNAIRLFEGTSLDGFTGTGLTQWTVTDGVLTAGARTPNRIASRAAFGDIRLHLEYREPDPPRGAWQYRGNSGVFLMGLYEVQILDSFDNPTYPDGQAAALYGQRPPRVNASLPPGRWQCLDIEFHAPHFVGATIKKPARITVRHNGVVVQRDATFLGPTAFAAILPYAPHADALPLTLQDHGDGTSTVSFRNIWALPLPAGAAPPQGQQ
jgi:hypothetical protein